MILITVCIHFRKKQSSRSTVPKIATYELLSLALLHDPLSASFPVCGIAPSLPPPMDAAVVKLYPSAGVQSVG